MALLSPTYIPMAMPICFRLLAHWERFARSLALLNAGKSIAARMAMIAMTTSYSMSVNQRRRRKGVGSIELISM